MHKESSRGKFEEWIEEDPEWDDGPDEPRDPMESETFRWVWCNLLPVLIITLVITLVVMFSVPIECVTEWWFRWKIVLAFVSAILLRHSPQIIRYIRTRF